MKSRHKLLFLPALVAAFGVFAGSQAFAVKPAAAPLAPLPKGAENLLPYMVSAANLGDQEYMQCVRSKMKLPAAQHVAENVASAQDCYTSKN